MRIANASPRSFRVAIIAPVATDVHPGTTWSIERVVSVLADDLVSRGHDVTLFATANSQSRARVSAVFEEGYAHDTSRWDWRLCESMNVAAAIERADEFDVIHSHAYHHALPFNRLSHAPIIHTYHVMPDPDISSAFASVPNAILVALSAYHGASFRPAVPTAVIGHGLPASPPVVRSAADPFLLYLGRLMRQKGPLEAIDIARRAGMPLVVAGPAGDAYDEAKPFFDGTSVRYVGAVDAVTRDRLVTEAAALVYPILRGEPFGLVMIEAMLAGTPVLAFDQGSVSELVESGVTGFVASDASSLVGHVEAALRLDRDVIQQRATSRFDVSEMVTRYLDLYSSAIRTAGRP